jgi:ComF family protein
MTIVERFIALIAPHVCKGCGAEGYVLCKDCVQGLQSVPPRCYACQRVMPDYRVCTACRRRSSLFAVKPVVAYATLPKAVIHSLKFARAEAAARDLAYAMAARIEITGPLVITHVPTVPARVRVRGYDQAALIARELSKLINVPYTPLLARTGSGRQVGQTRAQRRSQMERAFRMLGGVVELPAHVLIIDDVLTTGATCEAAARVLRSAGAKRVSAAVFAVA